jgi:aspartate/methionine/tyrosine aminotransferase
MNHAARIARLGTETAFAVSADAKAWADQGHEVYPFHLGDMNIRTPLNIIEAGYRAMLDKKTTYCPAAGIPELRAALADDVGRARGLSYAAENVSIQPGGKPSIGKFLMALMNEGDEVLYPNPGYPIYESQIEFLGGKPVPYSYIATDKGFRINRDQVEAALTPRTKLIMYNNGQNPLGAESDDDEMQWLAGLAQKRNLMVFSDEPYFDIRYKGKSKSIASVPGMQERTLIAYTFSKKYAMTGWRLGGAIGPKELIDVFNKLNVNHESCTTHFIQWAGLEALTGDQAGRHAILNTLEERRDRLAALLNDIQGVSVYRADVTFYLFPDVTEVYKRLGYDSPAEFRLDALRETGVSFCSRSHFGKPLPDEERVCIRFAYSGIDVDLIEIALRKLKAFWER